MTGSDQLQLRLRAPTGTRIERTEQLALPRSRTSRRSSGAGNVAITTSFVGVSPPAIRSTPSTCGRQGPHEAVLARRPRRRSRASMATRCASGCARGCRRRARMTGVVRSGRHRVAGDELRLADANRSRGAGRSTCSRTAIMPRRSGGAAEACRFCAISSSRSRSTTRRSTSTWTASAPASTG